MEPEKKSTDCT